MILLPQIIEYSNVLIEDISSLKTLKEIVSIENINAAGVSDIKRSDNDILYLVLPMYSDDLESADKAASYMTVDWFVVRKIDRAKGHEVFMDSFTETQVSAAAIREHVLATARGEKELECGGWLRHVLSKGSLDINPTYHLAGLNGWHITLTLPHYG